MSEAEQVNRKRPSLFRNYISLIGAAIVLAGLVSVTLLFLIEITASAPNPYLGILTYIVLPSAVVFGLLVIVVGMVLGRRGRRRLRPGEMGAYRRLVLIEPISRGVFLG